MGSVLCYTCHMNAEIERKFLVLNQSWKATARPVQCRQGYISTEPARTVRVRTAGAEGFLTIKGMSSGASRAEFEYPLPYEDAQYLLDYLCLKPLIEKKRWYYDYKGHTWEIDYFSGENEGLIVAEIELTSEAELFDRPDWLGQEVTGDSRYYNVSLMSCPYTKWMTIRPAGPLA